MDSLFDEPLEEEELCRIHNNKILFSKPFALQSETEKEIVIHRIPIPKADF